MNASRSRAGDRFGPYELRSLLGRGAMGEVYEAYDTHNDRVIALKLLPEELAQDPAYRERFRRESHAATRIADPHIVPIHRAGEIDGVLYLDMRLIRGDNLRALLRRQGPMEPDRAVHIVEQVAAALDAAHTAGLVHRDVKPANILVTPTDFAFLADFGIARSEGDSAMTMVGAAIGSYTYMAPERFDSGPVDGRADTYSLACVLHECLTGATPFPVQSVSVLIRSHLSEPPPRPSLQRSDVPPALDAVIAHAMSKLPADRFSTAGEFAGAARAAVGLSTGSEPTAAASSPTESIGTASARQPGDTAFAMDSPPTQPPPPPLPQRLAAGPGAPRPVVQATTFQPFGPQGPTIAAQFQPRGDGDAYRPDSGSHRIQPEPGAEVPPPAGSPTTVMRTGAGTGTPSTADSPTSLISRGPVPRAADDDIPATPAPAPRGYETTGSLRIIAPADPQDHDTSGDLPVITPADPTRVRREEFQFTPLPEQFTPLPPQTRALPSQAPESRYAAPDTELLPHGASSVPGSDDEYGKFGRGSEYGPGGGYERDTDKTGYPHEAAYATDAYAEDAAGGYEHPDAYGDYGQAPQTGHGYDEQAPHSVLGYGAEEDYDYDQEYEYDTTAGEDGEPKKRSGAVPLVLGVLGVALAAGVGVVGWQVLGKSGSTGNSTVAVQQSTPAVATTSPDSSPDDSTTTATATSTNKSTPPAGATACRSGSSSHGGQYAKSAAGSSATTCGFAEAVRKAYAAAAESGSGAQSSVVAVSPTTGRSYTMSCTASGRLITCTGGENAVVYVY